MLQGESGHNFPLLIIYLSYLALDVNWEETESVYSFVSLEENHLKKKSRDVFKENNQAEVCNVYMLLLKESFVRNLAYV